MRIKPSFWLALCFAYVFGFFREFALLLAAVTLHEMAHVIVGLIFHVSVTEVIITPLGEAAVLKGLDWKNSWVRAAVILAGPAMNLIIGFAGFLVFNISITDIAMPDKGFGLGYFFAANIALGLFNFLPAFPLDGGRFCQLILGNTIGVACSNRLLCHISRVVAVLMIIAGIIQFIRFSYNISLCLIGLFIIINIRKEQIKLSFDFFSYFSPRRMAGQRIPIKFYAVTSSARMEDLIDCLRWNAFSVFNIYFEDGAVSSFSEKDLMNYIRYNGLTGSVADIP